MKKSRTLRLAKDRLGELTPADLGRIAAGQEIVGPTPTMQANTICIATRLTATVAAPPQSEDTTCV